MWGATRRPPAPRSYSHDPDYKRLMPKALHFKMVENGPLASATAAPATKKRWISVCAEGDLKEGKATRLDLDAENEQVCVVRHRAQLFALDNRCAHQGGNLCAGDIEDLGSVARMRAAQGKGPLPRSARATDDDGVIRCPRHGMCFNIRTGEHVDNPDDGAMRQRTFPVRVSKGRVQVQVDVLSPAAAEAAEAPPPPPPGSFRSFLAARGA